MLDLNRVLYFLSNVEWYGSGNHFRTDQGPYVFKLEPNVVDYTVVGYTLIIEQDSQFITSYRNCPELKDLQSRLVSQSENKLKRERDARLQALEEFISKGKE